MCCLLILVIAGTNNNAFAQTQTKKKLKAVETSNNTASTKSSIIKVPYIVEIDGESAKNGSVITLAVNAITIIRCPEEPVNFYLGSSIGVDAFQAAEFDKALGRNEIYVRPRVAGINTNLAIEFASGPIVIYFKIIEVTGGNNAGDFTGEVVIKNSRYKDLLAETKASLLASNKETEKLKSRIQELEKQSLEKATSLCQEDKLTTLRLVEDAVIFTTKKNTIKQANVSVSQIGRVQKVKGGWIISLAIENRSKDFLSLETVESASGKVITSWTLPKKLSPKAETKMSVLIEDENLKDLKETSKIPNELTLLINGSPLKVKTSY
ncbi:MAG: hypothetical protein FD167_254 [bacterium]|nr:MAG: hypothetical protein FD167_254 [bacterium]